MGELEAAIDSIRGEKVYFDTHVLAYIFGESNPFMEASLPFFEALEKGLYTGFTGDLSFGELLVKPLKNNDFVGANKIKLFFDDLKTVQLISHTREDFEMMARIRVSENLKAFDAIQVATAIRSGCSVLVTNDNKMAKRASGIKTINVNDFMVASD